jgi:hypothetical protein
MFKSFDYDKSSIPGGDDDYDSLGVKFYANAPANTSRG